ncbi:MAG: class I mannose-6-phosphate isomerase [Bacteroidales bacterium]|nr:class I mannose-6-phosphate isomerase [Bacteroidales bacterium]
MKFHPLLKEKLWGGDKLQKIFGVNAKKESRIGEAWLLSGVEGSETVVSNGWLADNDLAELTEVFMGDLVGDKVFDNCKNQFPLLFKLIDAHEDLSVQVHPDDALAQQRGLENGKTEMWYIMQAEKESQLIAGFNTSLNKESFTKLLTQNRLEEVLNYEKVTPGDVFFTPAGRVHSIGKGILLAEIQQSSDTTYRIYDWNRTDDNGKPRPLHVAESLDAIDFQLHKEYKTCYSVEKNKTAPIVQSPYFTTNILHAGAPVRKNFADLDSFVVYLCVEGSFSVSYDGETTTVQVGETLLIPNVITEILIVPTPSTKVLEVFIP